MTSALFQSIQRTSMEAIYATEEISKKSLLMNSKRVCDVPCLSHEDVILGNFLARGGFNDVYELKKIKDDASFLIDLEETYFEDTSTSDDSEDERDSRLREVRTNMNHTKKDKRQYVVKFLSETTASDLAQFRTGIADLLLEAKILRVIDHPNVIKLKGISKLGTSGLVPGFSEGGYFLLLDRLKFTLEEKMDKWCRPSIKRRLSFTKQTPRNENKVSLLHRLEIAMEIASGLDHIHSLGIVYRDLKPSNVGFDSDGTVKIFDFGLSREIDPSTLIGNDLYKMTGATGSPRYMAPEVGQDMPYNLLADVYSFSILLWELCTLNVPYKKMSKSTHFKKVIYGNHRPALDDELPRQIQDIMKNGWSEDISQRPSMKCIQILLCDFIGDMKSE